MPRSRTTVQISNAPRGVIQGVPGRQDIEWVGVRRRRFSGTGPGRMDRLARPVPRAVIQGVPGRQDIEWVGAQRPGPGQRMDRRGAPPG